MNSQNEENEDGKKDSKLANIIMILIFAFISLTALSIILPKPTTQSIEYGVKVVSEYPIEELRDKQYLAVSNDTMTPAELTCAFELSAISKPDPKGYAIHIQEGDPGIYLGQKQAYVKGRSQDEILTACHVFACLLNDIECPSFLEVGSFIENTDSMSIILDAEAGSAAGRGYAEITGVMSYLQSSRVDLNNDGFMDQSEIDQNDFFIYPFLKEADMCTTQPFNNLVQNWTKNNETLPCENIGPAIILTQADTARIFIENNQLFITGDSDQIRIGSIIIRDAISPGWIRRLYGFK